jgi:hypothetical protein
MLLIPVLPRHLLRWRGRRRKRRRLELHGLNGDGAQERRYRETQRREVPRACHGRERDLDVASAGDVFEHHAVGSVARNWPQHQVAYEGTALVRVARELLHAFEREREIVAPPSIEDCQRALAGLPRKAAAAWIVREKERAERIGYAAHMLLAQGDAIGRRGSLVHDVRDGALLESHFDLALLAVVDHRGGEDCGHQRRIFHRAGSLRAAFAFGKNAHQIDAAAARLRAVALLADLRFPGALPDADAGHGDGIAGIELLRARGLEKRCYGKPERDGDEYPACSRCNPSANAWRITRFRPYYQEITGRISSHSGPFQLASIVNNNDLECAGARGIQPPNTKKPGAMAGQDTIIDDMDSLACNRTVMQAKSAHVFRHEIRHATT